MWYQGVKFLAGVATFRARLEECNTAADQLLEGAGGEVPSMAVDYGTAEDGRKEHVAAAFDLSLKPLAPPQPTSGCKKREAVRLRVEARLREEAEARQREEEEDNRLRAEEEEAEEEEARQQAALTQLFGTGELGDLVVQGVATVPSGQVLMYANVTVRPETTIGRHGTARVVVGRAACLCTGSAGCGGRGQHSLVGAGLQGSTANSETYGQGKQGESSLAWVAPLFAGCIGGGGRSSTNFGNGCWASVGGSDSRQRLVTQSVQKCK